MKRWYACVKLTLHNIDSVTSTDNQLWPRCRSKLAQENSWNFQSPDKIFDWVWLSVQFPRSLSQILHDTRWLIRRISTGSSSITTAMDKTGSTNRYPLIFSTELNEPRFLQLSNRGTFYPWHVVCWRDWHKTSTAPFSDWPHNHRTGTAYKTHTHARTLFDVLTHEEQKIAKLNGNAPPL